MDFPAEFRKLALALHQEVEQEVAAPHELIDYMISFLTLPEREVVRIFLGAFLAANPTPREALDLWTATGPDWYVEEAGMIPFLSAIRDELG